MIGLVLEAFAGLVSFWLGFAVAQWRRRTSGPSEPICGCGHHASYHNESGCHEGENGGSYYYSGRCGCVKYIGPEPALNLEEALERAAGLR